MPFVLPSVVVMPPIMHFASMFIASFMSYSNLRTDSWIVMGPRSVSSALGSPSFIFYMRSAIIWTNFAETSL